MRRWIACSLLAAMTSCAHPIDGDVRRLQRAARSCDRVGGTQAAALYRCDLVLSRLHAHGASRDRREWIREAGAKMSCETAVSAVADLELAAAEVEFPYLPEHSQMNRIWTMRALLDRHARQLLACEAGEALQRQLAASDRYAAAAPSSLSSGYSLALELAADDPTRAARVADASPSIAEALRSAPPDRCPTDDAGAVQLMRSHDPYMRAFGCSCVDSLPASARAESEATRDRLAESDPWQPSRGPTSASSRGGLTGALVDVLLAPLTSTGRANEHPVREFCREQRDAIRRGD